MPRSPQWMDLYQIWFRVSSRGRNQLCGILLQSAHGFRFCEGSKFAISRWLGRSPLTQCWRYRAACDDIKIRRKLAYKMHSCVQLLGGFAPKPPDQWLCPWIPLGAQPPDPHYRLALPRSPISPVQMLNQTSPMLSGETYSHIYGIYNSKFKRWYSGLTMPE